MPWLDPHLVSLPGFIRFVAGNDLGMAVEPTDIGAILVWHADAIYPALDGQGRFDRFQQLLDPLARMRRYRNTRRDRTRRRDVLQRFAAARYVRPDQVDFVPDLDDRRLFR